MAQWLPRPGGGEALPPAQRRRNRLAHQKVRTDLMHNLPVEEQHPTPQKGNGHFLPREKLASESRTSSDRSLPTAVFCLSGRKGPDRNFRPLKDFFINFRNSCHILRSGYILKYNPQKEEGDWGSEQARGLFREGISLLVDSQLHRKQGICIQI